MLNNSKKNPYAVYFDSKVYNPPSWTKYELYARPDIWYNGYDGIKTGLHVNGDYMNYFHVFDANLWFNTGLLQGPLDSGIAINKYDNVSLRVNYKTATNNSQKTLEFIFLLKY